MALFDELKNIEEQVLGKVEAVITNRWVLRGLALGGIVAFLIIVFAILN